MLPSKVSSSSTGDMGPKPIFIGIGGVRDMERRLQSYLCAIKHLFSSTIVSN
jgi:hypothetical protein